MTLTSSFPPARSWPVTLKVNGTLTVLLLAALMGINQFLINSEAPRGIISYQLAGSSAQSAAIISSWRPDGVAWAYRSLYLDFAFIGVYLLFLLQLTRRWLTDRPGVREQQVGRWARGLFITAAVADLGEGVGLLVALEHPGITFWPAFAAVLALIKFCSLLAGISSLIILRAARGQPLNPQS